MKKILFYCVCISVIYISSFTDNVFNTTPTTRKEKLTTFYYSQTQEEYQRKLALLYHRPFVAQYVNGFQYTDTLRPIFFDAKIVAVLKLSEADFSVPKERVLPIPVKFI